MGNSSRLSARARASFRVFPRSRNLDGASNGVITEGEDGRCEEVNVHLRGIRIFNRGEEREGKRKEGLRRDARRRFD